MHFSKFEIQTADCRLQIMNIRELQIVTDWILKN